MPRVAFQMDPLETLDPSTDTTLLLMAEALRRGYEVYGYEAKCLSYVEGRLVAQTFALPASLTQSSVPQGSRVLDLMSCDVVWIRQDPPFSMSYLVPTYLLQTLEPQVRVVNAPWAIRNSPEKLWPLLAFTSWMPPTLLTRDPEAVKAFLDQQGEIVLKPLFGYGGAGISYVHREDTRNLSPLLSFYFQHPEPLLAQKYVPQIQQGDTRVFFVGGEVVGAVAKIPPQGQFVSNVSHGGRVVPAQLTAIQRERCQVVAQTLKERGILFAGADWIGEWLLEINLTSPTLVPAYNRIYGEKLEERLWDGVERMGKAKQKGA